MYPWNSLQFADAYMMHNNEGKARSARPLVYDKTWTTVQLTYLQITVELCESSNSFRCAMDDSEISLLEHINTSSVLITPSSEPSSPLDHHVTSEASQEKTYLDDSGNYMLPPSNALIDLHMKPQITPQRAEN